MNKLRTWVGNQGAGELRAAFIALALGAVLAGCGGGDGEEAPVIKGQVFDRNLSPIAGVFVSAYGVTGTTDAGGSFELPDVTFPADRVVVEFQKTGYFNAKRCATPVAGEDIHVKVIMLERQLVGTVDATAGGRVATGGMSVSIPRSALGGQDGTAPQGQAKVYAAVPDPDGDYFGYMMPGGDFRGLDPNGSPVSLLSYGVVVVEVEDQGGNLLAPLKDVTIQVDIPPSLLAGAPAQLPVWSLAASGFWEVIGNARKSGNRYSFPSRVFGPLNVDAYDGLATIVGRVCDVFGDPAPAAEIRVGMQYRVLTGSNGRYSVTVPAGRAYNLSGRYGSASLGALAEGSVTTVNFGSCSGQDTVEDESSLAGTYVGTMNFCVSASAPGVSVPPQCHESPIELVFDENGILVVPENNCPFSADMGIVTSYVRTGNVFTLVTSGSFSGINVTVTFVGTFNGDQLTGTITGNGSLPPATATGDGTFAATRQ